MSDLIQRGQVWQDGKRDSHRTSTVTIKRGVVSTTDVLATRGAILVQSLDDQGNIMTTRTLDYIIKAADYAFSGVASPPAEYDQIIDDVTGDTLTFEVLPAAGEPAARFTNSFGLAWRIHTAEVLT
jgi:hypothetical protein